MGPDPASPWPPPEEEAAEAAAAQLGKRARKSALAAARLLTCVPAGQRATLPGSARGRHRPAPRPSPPPVRPLGAGGFQRPPPARPRRAAIPSPAPYLTPPASNGQRWRGPGRGTGRGRGFVPAAQLGSAGAAPPFTPEPAPPWGQAPAPCARLPLRSRPSLPSSGPAAAAGRRGAPGPLSALCFLLGGRAGTGIGDAPRTEPGWAPGALPEAGHGPPPPSQLRGQSWPATSLGEGRGVLLGHLSVWPAVGSVRCALFTDFG